MAVKRIKPKPETKSTSSKDTKKADERKTGGSRWRKLARKTLGFKGG